MSIIGLLVVLIVALVVIWAVRSLLAAFSIGDPIATVVYVILVLIFVLWFVEQLGFVAFPHIAVR
jgi:hypothetical protein